MYLGTITKLHNILYRIKPDKTPPTRDLGRFIRFYKVFNKAPL